MPTFSDHFAQFVKVARDMEMVVEYARANGDWSNAYDMIFSTLKPNLPSELPPVEWCDPDCGYEDDVMAFVRAVMDRRDEYLRIMGVVGNPLKPHEVNVLETLRSAIRIINAGYMSDEEKLTALKRHYLAPLINLDPTSPFYQFLQYEYQPVPEQLSQFRLLAEQMVNRLMGFS